MEFFLAFAINVVRIYKYAILVRVLLSWMGGAQHGRVGVFFYQLTEPVLRLFRSILPRFGMLDLSPLIAFIALDFLQLALIGAMADI